MALDFTYVIGSVELINMSGLGQSKISFTKYTFRGHSRFALSRKSILGK